MKHYNEEKDYTNIAQIAAKFGFVQCTNPTRPHIFQHFVGLSLVTEVDLSASGESEYAVAKNIISQMAVNMVDVVKVVIEN